MGCNSSKDGEATQAKTSVPLEYTDEKKPDFGDSKSLLAKYLDDEIWEKLKDSKDKVGFSFRQAINSGVRNLNSGIGVYAGSADSYTAFVDLFAKIIQDYHQFKPEDNHVSDMDASKLDDLENLDPEGKYIISTRIRVGRNLDEFPLGPAISKEQRVDMEKKLVEVFKQFEGDLAGKYYPLKGMDKATQKQLIEDHFLFKEGDKYLEACGLNRDWPEGRGIFHNEAKNFLVWVNEEDHLRIISMEKGADIKAVFKRLSDACTKIDENLKFAHNDHLGYITSCPTNLGTALRASVHIKLPKLCENTEKRDEICEKYFIQPRGVHGEHSESEGGIVDVSNKRRLGRSEVDLVRDMYDGVKALLEAEKELESAE